MPNPKLLRKEAKTSARVLTSNKNRKMLEEKESFGRKGKEKKRRRRKKQEERKKLNLRDLQEKDQKVFALR